MKYAGLIWNNVWRKKVRASLTVLSVFVAFLLFAILSAVGHAFKGGEGVASAERLLTIEKVSLTNLLPIAYKNRIATTPGVRAVTHATWFGGYYREERNQFPQFPVVPEEYLSLYPELALPAEQMEAWARNRSGAIVGKQLAEKYGLSVGDRFPIQATLWPRADGNRTWEFDIEGIFSTNDARGSTAYLLFHYDYFDEARATGQGLVGWYIVGVEPGANGTQVSRAIDVQFANSPAETRTSTEQAFARSFARQLGNVALIVTLILGAVFFTLLLVSGNTMSQSVRERIPELAVIKTVGFGDRTVLGIVLSESILIMLVGGLPGLALGWILVQLIANAMVAFLPGVYLSAQAITVAIGLMLGAGVIAGLFPALRAMRLSVVDALAQA